MQFVNSRAAPDLSWRVMEERKTMRLSFSSCRSEMLLTLMGWESCCLLMDSVEGAARAAPRQRAIAAKEAFILIDWLKDGAK